MHISFKKDFRLLQTFFKIIFKPIKVQSGPIHIQIETNNSCNLNCQTCRRSEIIKEPRYLSLEKFKDIIDIIDPSYVTICGFGETFLHPQASQMFKYMKDKNISVNLTSNAVSLIKNYQWIVDFNIDLFSISLDAATPETYRKIRGSNVFHQIINGIKQLQKYKKKKNTNLPAIRLQMVVQQDNINELINFVLLAKNLNIEAVYFQVMNMIGLQERKEQLLNLLTPALIKSKMKLADETARKVKVATNLNVILKNFSKHYFKETIKKYYPCFYPWYTLMINLDGQVQPCCAFGGPNTGVYFGNIFEEKFIKMFNNEKFHNFRMLIKKGKRPYECCQVCVPLNLSEFMGITKFAPRFYKK